MQNQNNFKKHEQLKKVEDRRHYYGCDGACAYDRGLCRFLQDDGKDRKQQVDVYFNFIGNCKVPQKADIEKMY